MSAKYDGGTASFDYWASILGEGNKDSKQSGSEKQSEPARSNSAPPSLGDSPADPASSMASSPQMSALPSVSAAAPSAGAAMAAAPEVAPMLAAGS